MNKKITDESARRAESLAARIARFSSVLEQAQFFFISPVFAKFGHECRAEQQKIGQEGRPS